MSIFGQFSENCCGSQRVKKRKLFDLIKARIWNRRLLIRVYEELNANFIIRNNRTTHYYMIYNSHRLSSLHGSSSGHNTHTYIHTYIQPFGQYCDLASQASYVCALNLYVSGGTHSWTSIPNDRFLRNFFMAEVSILWVFTRYMLHS